MYKNKLNNFYSVIIPVYNEADIIEKNIKNIKKTVEKITENYELIISEDGSTDKSYKIIKKISEKHNKIKYIHFKKKQGKGGALMNAFKKSKGDILVFLDIDLSTDLNYLSNLINAIKNGADIAIGSRMKNSYCKRSLKRNIAAYCYNMLVRLLFRIKLYDTQCGFKAFRREKLFDIMPAIEDRAWFWDTELLLKAHKKKYKIIEIPIKWKEENLRKSKVNLFKDGIKMGVALIKLRIKLLTS